MESRAGSPPPANTLLLSLHAWEHRCQLPAASCHHGGPCTAQPPPTTAPTPPLPLCRLCFSCSCFNWIDKRVNHSRWLTLDSIQEGPSGGSGTGKWYFGNKAPAHLVPPLNSSGGGGIHSWGPTSGGRAQPPPPYHTQPMHYSGASLCWPLQRRCCVWPAAHENAAAPAAAADGGSGQARQPGSGAGSRAAAAAAGRRQPAVSLFTGTQRQRHARLSLDRRSQAWQREVNGGGWLGLGK